MKFNDFKILEQNLEGDALYAKLIKQQFPIGSGYDIKAGATHEMWYRELKLANRWLAMAVKAGDFKPPVSIGNDFTIRDKNGQNIGVPGQWNPSMKPKAAKPIAEYGVGRITKQNTTADVKPGETKRQAAKFGFKLGKDGRPPTLSKKVKGSKTNVLWNFGLAETNRKSNLIDFINFCKQQLDLKNSPPIKFVNDTEDTTFGYFDNDNKNIVIQNAGRHQMDVMRTVAHELVHYKQDKMFDRELNGEDGSPDENQANSIAGIILRRWGQKNPSLFTESVDENTQSSVYFTNMQEQLGEIAKTTEIYVDMDGVLADFFGEWTKLMNVDHWSKIDNDGLPQALQKIRDTDQFWLKLPLLPQAKELLTLIKNIKGEYNICSSPLADDPNSEPHKREWIKNNLSFFPPKNVYITHDKAQFAKNADGTSNILIDDFGRNVRQWEDAGGIGFKYKDHKFERTAKQLQKHIAEEKMSKSDIKSAHKKADKLKDKPKAKKSISKWAKEKGMDPEGAIYAIAMNQQKKKASESYARNELPQISRKQLKTFPHILEIASLKKLIPVQKERLKENFNKQLKRIHKGIYNPIVVDSNYKIVNGHHRYDILKLIEMKKITVAKLPFTLERILEVLDQKKNLDNLFTPSLKKLNKIFTKNKHEIRIVGGAVRDIALGKDPKDIDLATDATPDEMINMLDKAGIKHKPTGLEHGTITAIIDKEPYEITTLRADVDTDGRHAEVKFVRNWKQDAQRRDLTYNAMSMDFGGKIHDYFDGMNDLQNKVSKFVGDPEERIKEDYLRILRYFRFQGRLNKPQWEENVTDAIKKNAGGLKKISAERIWQEMSKILGGGNVKDILTYMDKTGIAKTIGLPVKDAGKIIDNDDPIINLARLVDNDNLAKEWKLSKEDHTTLLTLVKNKDKKLTQKAAEDLIVDGKNKTILSKLAELQGNKELANYIKTFDAPVFPITGNDLISMGYKPGPELGKTLNRVKSAWKQSNFTANKDDLLQNLKEDINPTMPNFDYEWQEAQRYPEFEKLGKEMWIKLAKQGKIFTLTKKDIKDIHNTDAGNMGSFKKLEIAKQLRVLDKLKKGEYELPIVAMYSDGWLELIGGNTRLTAMMGMEDKAKVWVFKVPDKVANLAVKENFADGKKKGKSRPGRVKRSGASCKGSVTSLRAKAKKASGERAKMYHWCANMKSGRKK